MRVRTKPTPVETIEFCKYKCGNIAKFISPSGAYTCCMSPNSCPIMREKNAKGNKGAYSAGRIGGMTGKKAWNKGLTKETNEILRATGEHCSEGYKSGRNIPHRTLHTEEFKARQSKNAIARGLGGHTSKQKLYFEKNDGSVVYLQSSYEIRFAKILEALRIEWSRPEPLPWIDDSGKSHRYYPDFKVGKIYIDTKNDYLAVKDKPKIDAVVEQNNVDVRIVTEKLITKEYILALNP
jgi:hypothetical protein